MPNISLPTGKVVYISTYEWLFQLEEDKVDEFYQSAVADDLGVFLQDPFSHRHVQGKLEIDEEDPEIDSLLDGPLE